MQSSLANSFSTEHRCSCRNDKTRFDHSFLSTPPFTASLVSGALLVVWLGKGEERCLWRLRQSLISVYVSIQFTVLMLKQTRYPLCKQQVTHQTIQWPNESYNFFFNVISQLENADERGVLSLLLQQFTVWVLISLFPPLPLSFIAELTCFLIWKNPAL